MKRFSLLFVMLGCGLLVACTEDVYNEERVKEDYTQHFVDLFGSIDANQDWNMAEQKSVMVEPGTVSDIRIYAKNGEINKLVGYYQEISGKQTLTFDAAKAVNDFVVTAGGQARWGAYHRAACCCPAFLEWPRDPSFHGQCREVPPDRPIHWLGSADVRQ